MADQSREFEDPIKGDVSKDSVVITSVQSSPFICEFAENTFDSTGYNVRLSAQFPFVTSAYNKRYVIDEDRLMSLQSQGIDFYQQYDIKDKDPTSTFTAGPVKLGVATLDPLIPLAPNAQKERHVFVKLENNFGWHGELKNITRLAMLIPKGCKIKQAGAGLECIPSNVRVREATNAACNCDQNGLCLSDCDQFNIYEVDAKSIPITEDTKQVIIDCTMVADPSPQVLANRPVAIVSFRAVAEYIYRIDKEVRLSMYKSRSPDDGHNYSSNLCDMRPTVELDQETLQSVADYPYLTEQDLVDAKKLKRCFPLLFGIVRQGGFHFHSKTDCLGRNCGITRFTPEMLEAVQGKVALPGPPDQWESWTQDQISEIDTKVASTYINDILMPMCEGDNKAECVLGKYYCGERFKYGDYYSCLSTQACYYCHDTFIPQVLSYAYGYDAGDTSAS
jgi:hypothetical protein